MYCAYDLTKQQVVAVHDDREPVDEYINNICWTYRESKQCPRLERRKIGKGRLARHYYVDIEELYLTKYNNTWIQQGMLSYADFIGGDRYIELNNTKSILMSMLRDDAELSKKDRSALSRVIMLLEDEIADEGRYTPQHSELKSIECDYGHYIHRGDPYYFPPL